MVKFIVNLIFSLLFYVHLTCAIYVRQYNLTIGNLTQNNLNYDFEDIYSVSYDSTDIALNVTVWTNASQTRPLLIVIRQEKGLISLTLPANQSNVISQNMSRILCPAYTRPDSHGRSIIHIDFYTSSEDQISYSLHVDFFKKFIVHENSITNLIISPFAPVFLQYTMNSQSSIAKFTSTDQICTSVSVQQMECPIFDLKHTIGFKGQYQTMTRQSAITISDDDRPFKSMFIVMSVHSNDFDCCENEFCSQSTSRIKNITLELLPGYDIKALEINFAITLSFFLAIYIIVSSFLWAFEPYKEVNLKKIIQEVYKPHTILTSELVNNISEPELGIENINYQSSINDLNALEANTSNTNSRINDINTEDEDLAQQTDTTTTYEYKQSTIIHREIGALATEDNSFSSNEYDKVEDIEIYKETIRSKPNIKVRDLSRKHTKLLDRKISNYTRSICSIAIFYTLPVIQLILMYQTQLIMSGDEDSCYFNFLCMVRLGPFAAFNNVFSNIGYVLLGILFLVVVKVRSAAYKLMRKKYPLVVHNYGIPQHFGLFYTLGVGLIVEGILSAAYHTCPSYNNFQYDTSFMYVIGAINIIKLYQCRHPDIHPSSQKVFSFLAFCIFLNVIGVFFGKGQKWFMYSYCVLHILFFLYLSLVVYYMRQPKFSLNIFKELKVKFQQRGVFSRPTHIERLIMLLIGFIFNASLAIYAAIKLPIQFSSHLLNVFLGNFLLYFLMYLILKIIHREKFSRTAVLNLIIATVAWIAALYFFDIQVKYWEKKPAESREANKECILLKVYDYHDAWHFLSAISMFMSFIVILTLDDGIINVKRELIHAF